MGTALLIEKTAAREKKRTTSMAFAWVEQITWRVNMTTFNLNKLLTKRKTFLFIHF